MVSIGEIIYRLQENPLLQSIKKSDVVNHVKTVIDLIGAPGLYEDKHINLEIINFQAQIPKDYKSRTTVRRVLDNNYRVTLGHNTDDAFKTYPSLTDSEKETVDLLYTHKIVGDFIYVDFEEGNIELIYKAFKLDKEGFPYIEGDESVRLAIEWYIKQRKYEILWTLQKLPERVYQHALQQYHFYVGQATNAILLPDPVEAEAIGNAIIRLIPQTDNFESGYKYDSQKERRKTRF